MNFILQREGADMTQDQCLTMLAAERYYTWFGNPFKTRVMSLGEIKPFRDVLLGFKPEEWCPVGTIEFVLKYIETYFGTDKRALAEKPVNIPECLLGNTYRRSLDSDMMTADIIRESEDGRYFVKGCERLKDDRNGFMTLKKAKVLFGEERFQASEVVDIISEWRGFVHNGTLYDIKNYDGDTLTFPDVSKVKRMVDFIDGETSLREYTIDVLIDKDGHTDILECHRFFSCGLYGFADLKILPFMYWRTFKEIIK